MTDLFGETEPPRKARKKKAPPQSDGSVARALDLFKAEHARRWHGVEAMVTYGRDGRIMKELVAALGETQLAALIRAFFATKDARVQACSYTVPDLRYHAPRLRLRLAGNGSAVDARTAANQDAVRRAQGKE
jgi:hypothetical protein